MDPANAFVSVNRPNNTDFGDGIFEGNVPAGWHPVVHAQPTHGTVEISGATGWRYIAPAYTGSDWVDSWQFKVTDGTSFGAPMTVPMELSNLDA